LNVKLELTTDGIKFNIVRKFNDRPMKCLDFQTPDEVFRRNFGLLPV